MSMTAWKAVLANGLKMGDIGCWTGSKDEVRKLRRMGVGHTYIDNSLQEFSQLLRSANWFSRIA